MKKASEKPKIPKTQKGSGDFWVLILSMAISLFGVVMDFSASYYVSLSKFGDPYNYLKEAAQWFCIGWIGFFIISNIDFSYFKKHGIPCIALFFGFLFLTLIFTPLGLTYNNATRWLQFGPVTIMPGEIMKTCCILFFSWAFSVDENRARDLKWILISFAIAGVAAYLIYKQPNLSTAVTVVGIVLGIIFLAGLPMGIVAAIVPLAGLCLFLIVKLKGGYMLERLTGFLDPFADALGSGYQVVQGLLALGTGGLFGVGLGNSIQKAFYLPEPQSDFILAIIGEELGFAGIFCLLLAYLGLIYAIFRIAMNCEDRFGRLFAGGVGIHFGIQVVLNVAIVTASFPPTGIALPLVSLGGNSLGLFLVELGIVYNISKKRLSIEPDSEVVNIKRG